MKRSTNTNGKITSFLHCNGNGANIDNEITKLGHYWMRRVSNDSFYYIEILICCPCDVCHFAKQKKQNFLFATSSLQFF